MDRAGGEADLLALPAPRGEVSTYHTVDYGPFIKSQLAVRQLTFRLFWCKIGHVTPQNKNRAGGEADLLALAAPLVRASPPVQHVQVRRFARLVRAQLNECFEALQRYLAHMKPSPLRTLQ